MPAGLAGAVGGGGEGGGCLTWRSLHRAERAAQAVWRPAVPPQRRLLCREGLRPPQDARACAMHLSLLMIFWLLALDSQKKESLLLVILSCESPQGEQRSQEFASSE